MPALATIRTGSLVVALALGIAPAFAAPEPTLSDIAGCNEQAAARTSASAAPDPGPRTPETARRDPAGPRAGRTAAPMPGTGGPGEKTDPSGAIITETPDPLVKGMDASKADDPPYRAAYRACMRTKLGGR